MAKAPVEAPRPWVDEASNGDHRALGELFRSVAEPEALSPAALAQVHARLGTRRSVSLAQRRVRELVLALVMMLAGSSLALAGWGVTEWWRARQREVVAPVVPTAASTVARTRPAPAAAAPLPAPLNEAEPTDAGVVEPLERAPVVAPSAAFGALPAALPSASSGSALAAESAALEGALVKLRREHDAAGALALLDRSQALFAHGALSLEARVARVDALLALGRKGEALQLLERFPFAQIGRGGELRLLRAELRAGSDCASALGDFDVLVTRSLAPALAERALYGRAACELHVGDSAHAHSDFARYLKQYPSGRFAANVRAELSRGGRQAP